MSDAPTQTRMDGLVAGLVADLRPVRRAGAPWVSALAWLALVSVVALGLAWFADMPAVETRLMAATDMWMSVVGSTVTAILGAFAAFQLARPDRSPWWSLLPLPGVVLWLTASGVGCARTWLVPGATDASLAETGHCLRFIIGLSIPLSIAIVLLLRRGYSLYPTLMGGTAGLAVAAAAATLLTFFHPFDATVEDLSVHGGAVLVVVLANRAYGAWSYSKRAYAADRSSPAPVPK